MRAWMILLLGLIACRSSAKVETTGSGSGSGSAIVAPPVDAAPPPIDADVAAKLIDRPCDLRAPKVHCVVTPKDGAVAGEVCWRALVAVIEPADKRATIVPSDPTCTHDLARGKPTELELAVPKPERMDACKTPDACRIILVRAAEVAAETKQWLHELHDELVQADLDKQPASDRDEEAMVSAYMKLDIDETMAANPRMSHDEAQASVANGGPPPIPKVTHAQAQCAIDSGSTKAFFECLKN